MISAEARNQLQEEWNDTAVAYPSAKCVHELFEEQVERTPDAVALVFEDQALTYREQFADLIRAETAKWARVISAAGVKAEPYHS